MLQKAALPVVLAALGALIWTGALLLGEYLSKDFVRKPLLGVAPQATAMSPELEQLLTAAEKEPQNIELRMRLSESMLEAAGRQGKPKLVMNAIDHLRHVLSIDPKHTKALGMLAEISFNFGVHDKAAAYYRRYLNEAPEDSQAALNYSLSLIQLGQGAKAVELLEALIENKPDLFPGRLSLALAYRTTNMLEQAEKAAAEAAKIAPDEHGRQAAQRFIAELQEMQRKAQPADLQSPHDTP